MNYLVSDSAWHDCIEMLGPEDAPNEALFGQPLRGLRPIRPTTTPRKPLPTTELQGPHPALSRSPWVQKIASKTKMPSLRLL